MTRGMAGAGKMVRRPGETRPPHAGRGSGRLDRRHGAGFHVRTVSGSVIQPAHSPNHWPAVRELFLEYARSLDFSLCFQGFDEELATLPGAYAPPGGGLWLAEARGQPAGCVALRPLGLPGTAEVKRLYVRPAARGCGLGRALAETAIRAARAAGHARLVLDTVPAMAAAIALYRALGFTPIPPYTAQPPCGALAFELRLS